MHPEVAGISSQELAGVKEIRSLLVSKPLRSPDS
jgi:hypothetical protein